MKDGGKYKDDMLKYDSVLSSFRRSSGHRRPALQKSFGKRLAGWRMSKSLLLAS